MMMMGGTASQDGNLAQLSKMSKEKPPVKRNLTWSETFSELFSHCFHCALIKLFKSLILM